MTVLVVTIVPVGAVWDYCCAPSRFVLSCLISLASAGGHTEEKRRSENISKKKHIARHRESNWLEGRSECHVAVLRLIFDELFTVCNIN